MVLTRVGWVNGINLPSVPGRGVDQYASVQNMRPLVSMFGSAHQCQARVRRLSVASSVANVLLVQYALFRATYVCETQRLDVDADFFMYIHR